MQKERGKMKIGGKWNKEEKENEKRGIERRRREERRVV